MFHLRRGMIAAEGAGWAVTAPDGTPKPGRWSTKDKAVEQGLLGVYLLSGVDVVYVDCPAEVNR